MVDEMYETPYANLVEAARDCVEAWENLTFPLRIAPPREITFRVGFPLAAHALNHITVALENLDRFPLVAAGSARIAIEHALSAQWVFWTHRGPDTLVNHMEAGYLARVKAFHAATKDHPDLTQLVDEADLESFGAIAERDPAPGHERSWSMQNVFGRFAETTLFFDIYRELSGGVHPSYSTVETYLCVRDGPPASLSRLGHSVSAHTSAQAVALAGVFALDFLERCEVPSTRQSRAAKIAQSANLPSDLSLSDQRPDLQPRDLP